ncbi:MAG TPA: lasso peptide biosynthesis B2 protein [Pseudoneobacillus sp.]|nr:lasso peptide biosynthesis B2 protein [Pseudoneobacillus sp.]
MYHKIKIILHLDIKAIRLLLEAYFYLGWVRCQLLCRSFSKIAPSLGVYMKETALEESQELNADLKKIRHSIKIMSKYTHWDSKCLVRAIAAMKMLERRKINSTLYLGTGKDENGKMIAHAWLRSGSLYVTGYEEMHRFTVSGMFAKVTSIVGEE